MVPSVTRAEPPWSTWGLREPFRWAEKPSCPQKGCPIHGWDVGEMLKTAAGAFVSAVPPGCLTKELTKVILFVNRGSRRPLVWPLALYMLQSEGANLPGGQPLARCPEPGWPEARVGRGTRG